MLILEIVATVTGIIAVALQAKEKITAWPFAIVSVTIMAYIFFNSKLYSDFGLHIIYIGLNIFGWYVWSSSRSMAVKPTRLLNKLQLAIAIGISFMGAIIIGFLMTTYTDADLAYFDAFTTSTSLVAQYLLAKKYLQNWLLWIIADLVALPVYLYKGLYYIAFLFLAYLLLSIWGYQEWRKNLETKT